MWFLRGIARVCAIWKLRRRLWDAKDEVCFYILESHTFRRCSLGLEPGCKCSFLCLLRRLQVTDVLLDATVENAILERRLEPGGSYGRGDVYTVRRGYEWERNPNESGGRKASGQGEGLPSADNLWVANCVTRPRARNNEPSQNALHICDPATGSMGS